MRMNNGLLELQDLLRRQSETTPEEGMLAARGPHALELMKLVNVRQSITTPGLTGRRAHHHL